MYKSKNRLKKLSEKLINHNKNLLSKILYNANDSKMGFYFITFFGGFMKKINEAESWIIVANAQRAKFFAKNGKHLKSTLDFIEEIETDLDSNHEKPGRTFNSTGSLRHAIEPHTDRREIEKEHFARKIYEYIKNAERENRFQGLILLASPKMLEMIQKVFDKELQKKVQHSITKNITDLSGVEVREYLLEHEII